MIVFEPENPVAGIVFYPGGKVEYEAYAPLMKQLAKNGYYCVLLHMPFNLAVLDSSAASKANEFKDKAPKWYLCGHSLGGAFASKYIASHTDEFDGLILLGAYSSEDLSDTDLSVLCIYGSNDKVMNHDKYEKNRANLPKDSEEDVIDGGCHAYFGDYGAQKGDGTPSITVDEQIETTVDYIVQWMKKAGK